MGRRDQDGRHPGRLNANVPAGDEGLNRVKAKTRPKKRDQKCDEAEWQVRVDLAACYRLAALFGWTDLVYPHISGRLPGVEHLLLNRFGLAFDEVTASNLVKIDYDGKVVDGSDGPVHQA